jgi:TolB-like protein/cytochrome c-type biogenesis protein CcmH/NrfG
MLYLFDKFVLDRDRLELRADGIVVAVEPQVFDLLVYLIENRERVVSKDDLIASVWCGRSVSDSTLDSRVNAARKALGDDGKQQRFIRTMARKGIRFIGDVRMGDEAVKSPEKAVVPTVTAPEKPSIAVLPFANLSGNPEDDAFVDGVTEEIITALSRVRWFFVIARGSAFAFRGRETDVKQVARDLRVRYVLAGSIRHIGNRIRATARLMDGITGGNVWARSYDRALSDIFAVQDDITQTIAGAIEPELSLAERERARIQQPESMDAWTAYQRGMAHLYRYTRDDLAKSRQIFAEAIAIDAELGPAYSGLAEAHYYEVVYGFADSADDNQERAMEAAQHAVELDPRDAGAHCTLGRIRYLRREYTAAIAELEVALDLNPNLALAHYGLGAALVFSGKPREAFSHLESAIRLSPHDPNMGSFLVRMAEAKYLVGDDESAVPYAARSLSQPAFQWSRYAIMIAALGQLGHLAEAQNYIVKVTRNRPTFSVSFVRTMHPFSRDMGIDRYYEGLRKAGVVETAPGDAENANAVKSGHLRRNN